VSNKYRRSVSFRTDTYLRLRAYCDEKRISMSAYVENLIRQNLETYQAPAEIEYPVFVPPLEPEFTVESVAAEPGIPRLPIAPTAEQIFTF
jgi:hypothetical protein